MRIDNVIDFLLQEQILHSHVLLEFVDLLNCAQLGAWDLTATRVLEAVYDLVACSTVAEDKLATLCRAGWAAPEVIAIQHHGMTGYSVHF